MYFYFNFLMLKSTSMFYNLNRQVTDSLVFMLNNVTKYTYLGNSQFISRHCGTHFHLEYLNAISVKGNCRYIFINVSLQIFQFNNCLLLIVLLWTSCFFFVILVVSPLFFFFRALYHFHCSLTLSLNCDNCNF